MMFWIILWLDKNTYKLTLIVDVGTIKKKIIWLYNVDEEKGGQSTKQLVETY